MSGAPAPGAAAAPPTVWFLSDYGLVDEFVGVCHAIVRRVAPAVPVVDLTHGVTPFDVRAGSAALVRCVPHLGAGAVLAVVDPGVGSRRRAIVIEVDPGPGGDRPRWLVGPDNGLLPAAADALGGAVAAWALRRSPGPPTTFDGRDLFAPAAALLCAGLGPERLGDPVALSGLVRLEVAALPYELAFREVRTWVAWVDRYGNVQLDFPPELLTRFGTFRVTVGDGPPVVARRVTAFADLSPGELGVLVDANGQPALVLRERSAVTLLEAVVGDRVTIAW